MLPPTGGIAVALVLAFLCTITALSVGYALYSDGSKNTQPVLPSHYDIERYVTRAESVPGLCQNGGVKNDPGYEYCSECGEKVG
jgi:hypothetical protein